MAAAPIPALVLALVQPSEPRWPRWPTEVARLAAPLGDEEHPRAPSHHLRAEALAALAPYATEVITPWVIWALSDPHSSVRGRALELCWERQLVACVPPAWEQWNLRKDDRLPSATLPVLALDPTGPRLELLLDTLRSADDSQAAEAARILARARLGSNERARVGQALAARLRDLSTTVRQAALESLGLLQDRDHLLVVAQLVQDPEPVLQAAAAEALGRMGDPRGVAPLLRALATGGEPLVLRAILKALIVLPGERVDKALLEALDHPPTDLSADQVGEILAVRRAPSDGFIAGLIQRLDDPVLAPVILPVLASLGPQAGPAIRRELQRPASPALAPELRDLLEAWGPESAPLRRPAPDPRVVGPLWNTLTSWREQPTALALPQVVALARRVDDPPGLTPVIDADLARPGPLATRRMTLLLVGLLGPQLGLSRRSWGPAANLLGWAQDQGLPPTDRGLALVALATLHPKSPAHRQALACATRALADPDPQIRLFGVLAWNRLAPHPDDRGMIDPSPWVRVSAALGAWARGPTRVQRRRLGLLAATDPHPAVRAVARGENIPRTDRTTWVDAELPQAIDPWNPADLWVRLGHGLWAPALSIDGIRGALLPTGSEGPELP